MNQDDQNKTNNDQNQQNQIDSLATRDEIPLSVEQTNSNTAVSTEMPLTTPSFDTTQTSESSPKINEVTEIKVEQKKEPEKVESIFNQNANQIEEKKSEPLLNFQTNAINPNANLNINDFRINTETSNNEIKVNEPVEIKNEITDTPISSPAPVSELAPTTESAPVSETTPINSTVSQTQASINQPTSSNNSTAIFAVLGVVLAAGIVAGGYFLFNRNSTNKNQDINIENVQTEKIVVSGDVQKKEITAEEFKTVISSYITRYNKANENFSIATNKPNPSREEVASVFMQYSSEILDIYTGLINTRVPELYREDHQKLTFALYTMNELFDKLVKSIKDGTITENEYRTSLMTIANAQKVATEAFNKLVR